jgi:hypothetical protein
MGSPFPEEREDFLEEVQHTGRLPAVFQHLEVGTITMTFRNRDVQYPI